jgi:hypothetical protein
MFIDNFLVKHLTGIVSIVYLCIAINNQNQHPAQEAENKH